MTTACFPEAYCERIEREIIESKKTNEQYEHIPDLEYPNETRIVRIKQGRADHFNSNWSMKLDKDARMKLPTSQMWGGYEPQVYYHSEHRVPVPETDPKVEFNEGEDLLDDEWIEILKTREKLFSSLPEKDIPEEAMDIEEDHTAVWDARWENLQLVKVCRGPTGVEAAEAAATDFIKKVKIEEDIEGVNT